MKVKHYSVNETLQYTPKFHWLKLLFSRKADRLKERVINCEDLLNDNEAWLCQQQLQVKKIQVSFVMCYRFVLFYVSLWLGLLA